MAEEEGDLDSERFKEQLGSLMNCRSSDDCGSQSQDYCARFCVLVEDQTGRWQVPLPQLQVLRTALCCFTRDTGTFPSDCEHVRYTLSSLALSFFELLLFFGKDEFLESPLQDILESFQDCQARLTRHKNVYLLMLSQVIKDGGPWENAVLQAILRETAPPREEVERYLSSEVPMFFELRVRYLLACERVQEAVALAKCCSEHPDAGKSLYFHQVHLTCLIKASLYDHLQKEIAEIDGKDAVEIICNSETEERDDLLLALSRAFLHQQLRNGDMYYIWELIFIWSKIHLRANPSKQDFLEECHQLMLSATNVKSIFPFIKIIRDELGDDGLQFCVELCGRALQMDQHHDPVVQLLIYKTLAFLLPNDLEICRACALLVFFLERTVESYKTVYLLYTHPDQEYHADYALIKNHIRFEILQSLKKGLFFDPEFWNLITLRTNCLKLMSEKVMQAALNEITEEDNWIPNYCVKEPAKIILDTPEYRTNQVRKQPAKKMNKPVIKRIVVPPEVVEVSTVRKRGRKPGSRVIKVTNETQLRRSFRQLDMVQEHSTRQSDIRQQRLMARQAEKKILKRRGRKPRWFLQEMAKQSESGPGRPGRKKRLPTNAEVETKLHEHNLGQTDINMDKAQEISIDEASHEVVLTPPIPVAETADEETALLQEQELPPLAEPSVEDSGLIPIPVTMLEVSIPENEVIDRPVLEVKMQPLANDASQDPCLEESMDMKVVPAETLYKSCGKQNDSAEECMGNFSWCTLPPGSKGEESSIEVDSNAIHQLHNYSRNPVEENVEYNAQFSNAEREQFPITLQDCLSESSDNYTRNPVEENVEYNAQFSNTEREQFPITLQDCLSESSDPRLEPSGEVTELPLVELASSLLTQAGVSLRSEAEVDVPGSTNVAAEHVTEAVCHKKDIQAEESFVATDNISDMFSVPNAETTISDDPIHVPKRTIGALENCIENMTDTIDDLTDDACDLNFVTVVSNNKSFPNDQALSIDDTCLNDENIPKDGTAPNIAVLKNGTFSSNSTVPENIPVPNHEAVPNDEAVSNDVVPIDEALLNDKAVPNDETLINDNAVPNDGALINDEAVLSDEALVINGAVPKNEAVVNDEAVSMDEAFVNEEALVNKESLVNDEALVNNVTLGSDGALINNETLVSDDALVNSDALVNKVPLPKDEALIGNEALLIDEVLPNDEALPKDDAAPNDSASPIDYDAPNDTVVLSDEAIPCDVINSVINEMVALTDTVAALGQDCGLPSEPSSAASDIIDPEKVSSVPAPVSGPMPDAPRKRVLKFRCKLCDKEFKGGNIRRHAAAHLQKKELKCMFCGIRFTRPLIAKKHFVEHIEKLRLEANSGCSAPENETPDTMECVRQSLSRSVKHTRKPIISGQQMVLLKKRKYNKKMFREVGEVRGLNSIKTKRKYNKKPKVLQKLEEVKESKLVKKKSKCNKKLKDLQKLETMESNSIQENKPVQKANGSIVEGEIKHGKGEYLCPADGCAKRFVKKGMSMVRHAMASHPSDLKVKEFAFQWRKGKCEFCQRIFWSFLHYQDHIKRHDDPLKHVCSHINCTNRFKTRSELRAHLKSHQPLQVQCSFAECSQTFSRMSQLQDHEWGHYPGPETEEDLLRMAQLRRKVKVKQKDPPNDSHHRLKVQKKSTHSEDTDLSSSCTDVKAETESVVFRVKNLAAGKTCTVKRPVWIKGVKSPVGSYSDAQMVNGHKDNGTHSNTQVDAISMQSSSEVTAEIKNVGKTLEMESLARHRKLQAQKRVRPVQVECSGYGSTVRPFVRPPPSAYLDEQYISMPKRRKSSPEAPQSAVEPKKSSNDTPRQRCSKCFSSFNSTEALQSHLAMNKCTSLFDFDSDEESAS
ncbi:hypothetical protein GJAV_G00209710 [Gymnothorax javanicus]|nr:hypothetical protein GJAV_G00209710 [Gymnothorax javanicus]